MGKARISRRLMSWCVPNRALRFTHLDNIDLTVDHDQPGRRGAKPDADLAGSRNLLAAMTTHGVGPDDAGSAAHA